MSEPFQAATQRERKDAALEQECREKTKEFLKTKTGIAEQLLEWQARLAGRTPNVLQYLVELKGGRDDLVPWGMEATTSRRRPRVYGEISSSPRTRFCEIVVLHRGGVARTFLWLEKRYHPYDSIDGVLVTAEGFGHNTTLDRKPEKPTLNVTTLSIRDVDDNRHLFPTVTETNIPDMILLKEGDELEILEMPVPTLSPFGYFHDPSIRFRGGYQPDSSLKNEPILEVEAQDLSTAKGVLEALTVTANS